MIVNVKFRGIDAFNRPIFKSKNGDYYGSVDKLFSHGCKENEVLTKITESDLTYFGRHFGCEPMGTTSKHHLIINM